MIRINLLREKKAKRAPAGQGALVAGVGALVGAAVLIFVFVHSPLSSKLERQVAANKAAKKNNEKMAEETKDFETINQQYQGLLEQKEAIDRLSNARAVPAWLLNELSAILTKGQQPIMTPEMQERVKTDPNRQINIAWDPKRVWIASFTETDGVFTLKGGAQSDTDVTQLALRLQASVYFQGVVPEGGEFKTEKKTGVKFYEFTVTGKVVY
jgi:type IV pilus assembly protein PilN